MLERIFTNPFTVQQLRGGPAGPFLDGFAAALSADRYATETTARYVYAAVHLAEWAVRQGTAIADLDEALLTRFVRHLPVCRCRRRGRRHGRKRVSFRIGRFLRYLRGAGVVMTPAPQPKCAPLVAEYGTWMRERRGLVETTIARSQTVVEALLATVTGDPARLNVTNVRKFVLEYIPLHAPASAGCVTTIVRCFLRWLVATSRCVTDITEAVPKVPTWRLARLPRYLQDDDVERIIAACDRESLVARRDRAMLLLLARLGLRAADVVGLRLGDMDWRHARLHVAGKGRREMRLPLPQDVGDAILGYLETERPCAATDRVFLTAHPPIHPITSNGLRSVVSRAIERAGVQAPSHGSHTLRHSLATRLLREGTTLDAIGALLRHRDLDTTALYAKVDVTLLRQVAQPWPGAEVSPC